jgi:hypothetical protein
VFKRCLRHIAWAIYFAISAACASSATGGRPAIAPVDATAGVVIGGVPARTHDALFAGDILETGAGSGAVVRFSPRARATVLQDSSVRFQLNAEGLPLAKVLSGTVMVLSAGKRPAIVETARYRVKPDGIQPSAFFVALLPDQRTVIAARHGGLDITEPRSGEHYVLSSGRYIVMDAAALGLPGQQPEKNQQAPGKPAGQAAPPPLQPHPQPATSPNPPAKSAKQPWHIGSLSHGASIALILAAAAGAGGAVAAAAGGGGPSASPSAP